MIKILRGDDSCAVQITPTIPDGLDLAGAKLVFECGGLVFEFADFQDGVSFTFPRSWTSRQPVGRQLGRWSLVWPDGRKVTTTNTFPVYLTDVVSDVGGESRAEIHVPEGAPLEGLTLDPNASSASLLTILAAAFRRLGGTVVAHSIAVLICLAALSASAVQVSVRQPSEFRPALDPVVIGVDLSGLATTNDIVNATNFTLSAAKKYTDASIASAGGVTPEIVTNIVYDVAPAPGNYAAVSNSAMNAIQTLAPATNYTDNATNSLVEAFERDYVNEDTSSKSVQTSEHSAWAYEAGMSQEAFVAYELGPISGDIGEYRRYGEIFEQLDAATATNAAQSSLLSDIMTSDRTNSANIATLGAQVAAIGGHLNAEDAHFVSTNYDSAVRMPEAYVEIKLRDEATGSNTWITIWQEMRRWTAFVGSAFDWQAWNGFHAWMTNVTHELSFKADRCWGIYDSETGGYSPEGFTQISSSNILIAAGMAYQRTVTTGGTVWVLQCNQGVAHVGGDTNGFFRVLDGDGNVQFEIVKGDKREMGCDATGITVDNSTTPPICAIPYSVEAAEHPTLQICDDLKLGNWKPETDSDCIATVTWSGVSGAYVAMVQRKAVGNGQMFVKATFMAGGETYIRNVAPVGMDSIMLNGTRYYLGTATISGHTVLTLSTTPPAP